MYINYISKSYKMLEQTIRTHLNYILLGSYYIQAEYFAIYVFLYNRILLSCKAQFKLFKGNYGFPKE